MRANYVFSETFIQCSEKMILHPKIKEEELLTNKVDSL
jgi:hypothetical protein